MTTTPEAVEALGIAMYKNANEEFSGTIQEHAEAALRHLETKGFTITRAPQMTEAELKLAMEAAIYECEPERNKVKFAIEIAKKYRG